MSLGPRACIVGGNVVGVLVCTVAARGDLRGLVAEGGLAAYGTLAVTCFAAVLACGLFENAKRGDPRVASLAALLAVAPFILAAIGLVLGAREVAALAATHLERSVGSFFVAVARETLSIRTLGAGLVSGSAVGASAALVTLRVPAASARDPEPLAASLATLGIAVLATLVLLDTLFVAEGFEAYMRAPTGQRGDAIIEAVRASNLITRVSRFTALALVLSSMVFVVARLRRRQSVFSVLCALSGVLLLSALDAATVTASTRSILRVMPLGEDSALTPVPFVHEYVTDATAHCLAYETRLACSDGAPVPYATAAVPRPSAHGPRSARRTISVAFDARVRAPELRRFFRAARDRGYRAVVVHGGIVPRALAREDIRGFLRLLVPERSAFFFHIDAGSAEAGVRARAVTHVIHDDDTASTFLLRSRTSRLRYTDRFIALAPHGPPL